MYDDTPWNVTASDVRLIISFFRAQGMPEEYGDWYRTQFKHLLDAEITDDLNKDIGRRKP